MEANVAAIFWEYQPRYCGSFSRLHEVCEWDSPYFHVAVDTSRVGHDFLTGSGRYLRTYIAIQTGLD